MLARIEYGVDFIVFSIPFDSLVTYKVRGYNHLDSKTSDAPLGVGVSFCPSAKQIFQDISGGKRPFNCHSFPPFPFTLLPNLRLSITVEARIA